MHAADAMILLARRDAQELAVGTELEPIGRHFALRDRRAEPPRRGDEHLSGRRPAQAAAGGFRRDERLHEHRHRGVRRVEVVRRHVAQRPRRPQRRPARANGGQEFRFVLDAEIAFELSGEARPVTIFDQRRRAHDRRVHRSSRRARATRRAAGSLTAAAIGCSSSSSFIRSACRRASDAIGRGKRAAGRRARDPATRVEDDTPRRRDKTRPESEGRPGRATPDWPPWDRSGRRRSPRARTAERSSESINSSFQNATTKTRRHEDKRGESLLSCFRGRSLANSRT